MSTKTVPQTGEGWGLGVHDCKESTFKVSNISGDGRQGQRNKELEMKKEEGKVLRST